MFTEKREYHRIKIACKISVSLNGGEVILNSHTEDISAGGIMAVLDKEILKSTLVDLEVFLWEREHPIKCVGEIVWVNEIIPKEIKPRLFYTGIKFAQIAESDKEEVRQYVNAIISSWQ